MGWIDAGAVLFDLDGVLANSKAAVERAWRIWANEMGLNAADILAYSHGVRTLDTLERFAPGIPHESAVERLLALEQEGIDLVTPIPGAREFVQALERVPWAVATSGVVAIAEPRLRRVRIPIPSVFVTAERVRRGKPDPEAYLIAAAELGVDPQRCVVLEDAPAGVDAGKRAGARVVALLTTSSAAALDSADAIVQDFRDIGIEHIGGALRLHFASQANRSA
jgi:sugar-phosphatase